MEWLQRTDLLVGTEALNRLRALHVLVVGLGGVGAYAAEMLCRAGVGEMTIVDADRVEETNLNRQLLALTTTIGRPKTEVMAERLLQINPEVKLHCVHEFIRDERTVVLLQQALRHHFRLGPSNRCGQRQQLPVEVRLLHTIRIHDGHFTDSRPAQHLRRIRTHTT